MKNPANQALEKFTDSFLAFEMDSMPGHAQSLVESGVTVQDFLSACMPCMEEVGKKFEAGQYYLPQLVVAGEMFKTVSEHLKSSAAEGEASGTSAQIVLGTPAGDIHDLGKDIFDVLAQASGFTVHNLGVDAAPDRFVEKLLETKAPILGLSSLLTTTFESIGQIMDKLTEKGIRDRTFVILGGGATEQSLIEKLGVDAQTRDAYEGISIIRNHVQSLEKEAVA